MSRSRGDLTPAASSTTPAAAIPGRMLCAKEIPASKNQAAEASKDTCVRKIGPTGNKIRIRLPPRKATGGQCPEATSKSVITAVSKDTLPELNLTTATEVQVEEELSYPVRKELCEEGDEDIMSKGLPLEDSSSTPGKESYVEAIDNTPSKKLSVIRVRSEAEKNNNSSNIILSKRLLSETNSNASSMGVTEEAKINSPRKNLTTSAVKGPEAIDSSLGNNLFEEDRKTIATAKLSTKAISCGPSRRPADPANGKKSTKKLRTSAVANGHSGMKLSTSAGLAVEQSTSAARLEAAKEYKEFEEKVKRSVYLDNLSVLVTDAVVRMALNQFGNVKNVKFLTNYTIPFDIPQSALVEMETEKDAEHVVNMLNEFPFMMSGMPRPVRAKRATAEMFNDRPSKPGRKLEFCWVGPTDPDCHDVRKFKLMYKRHEVENLALIKNQLHEEALLAQHQQDNLNCNYRKLESIDSVIQTGSVNRLTRIYNLRFDEVY
ncbi:unnamed protein product [Urochloa decumbens]|uniref:RRM domain-containing protein n=1 Tax=Urochloa decumbens TaxID=240449 RepID=A0ABC9G8H4_9POAL